jgi:hypothetical protein
VSRRGLHTALALVGLFAGLPVAAVLQWNRRPPRVIWSSVPERFRPPGTDLFGPFPPGFLRIVLAPGGARITSVTHGRHFITKGNRFMLPGAVRAPRTLGMAGSRLGLPFLYIPLHFDPPLVVEVDGAEWHRVTTKPPMTR